MYINYPLYERHIGYTKLCYRDVNGVEHEVASDYNGQTTWEYCNNTGQVLNGAEGSRPTYSGLYSYTGTTSRITALKAALNEFAQAVADETDSFGKVDNKVSIVGFSSDGYNNTELLTGEKLTVKNNNGVQKNDAAESDYATALVAATNGTAGTVNSKITAAINAITANGGTQPEDGLTMAHQVLSSRGEMKYTIRSGERKGESVDRNTVVIFFTDGQPGNYPYSDQYAKANDVVEAAKEIKNYGTMLFTIGVFGESDGNPLTYTYAKDTSENAYWPYDDGYMETYKVEGIGWSPDTYYSLHRWWLAGRDGYPETANDTIYDYMSVVSSNYPAAEDFIAPAWLNGTYSGTYTQATDGVRHKESAETTNKYYRMASNQDTLVSAFLQAVTMNNQESSSSVPLNDKAVFKDAVNLSDFSVTGATYTVQWEPVKLSGGSIVNNGAIVTKVDGAAVPSTGKIEYTGFDYGSNYVAEGHPGYRLIVTINGIEPKNAAGMLTSNDGKAGIYGDGVTDPTVSIDSPTLVIPGGEEKTVLFDYNASKIVATNVNKLGAATGNNGKFTKSGSDVSYQLSAEKQADKTAEINSAYSDVDTAMVYGTAWNKIITIPASSVYYDDDLANVTITSEGHGKASGINDETVSKNAESVDGTFYFTFYGTGVDVYCTTHSNGGYVSAAVYSGSGESACIKDNRVGSSKTVRNYASEDYYNTPSVSFTDLPAGTYTLKLVANKGMEYKLDGVRVYNPVQAGSAAETALNKTDEGSANYLNLRSVLLNDTGKGVFTVETTLPEDGATDAEAVSGVLFIDDVENVVTESNIDADGNISPTPVQLYQTQYDVYKANGPMNEIYLDGQQAITFRINTDKVPAGTKVWIGLSAPTSGSGSVSITGKDGNVSVSSVMDMYYDFTVPATGSVTITNQATKDSGNIIAVTNLKITGIAGLIPTATADNADAVQNAALSLFRPVTLSTVRMAMNNGVDPEETVVPEEPGAEETPAPTPAPTPTPVPTAEPTAEPSSDSANPTPGISNIIQQIFSGFVSRLFGSIGRLFGN